MSTDPVARSLDGAVIMQQREASWNPPELEEPAVYELQGRARKDTASGIRKNLRM